MLLSPSPIRHQQNYKLEFLVSLRNWHHFDVYSSHHGLHFLRPLSLPPIHPFHALFSSFLKTSFPLNTSKSNQAMPRSFVIHTITLHSSTQIFSGSHFSFLTEMENILDGFPESYYDGNGLVVTDNQLNWNSECIAHGLLSQHYQITEEAAYHQAIEIPEVSESPFLQYDLFDNSTLSPAQSTFNGNSAFRKYTKGSTTGLQLCSASAMKQISLKRCFDFLIRMYKKGRERSDWEVDDGLVQNSYALTHKIAERNRRTKLSHQFSALRSLLPHNSKKFDKHSILSNAIMELTDLKLRIAELEERNQTLMNAGTRENISEGDSSSLSHGHAGNSISKALVPCICEEALVVVEDSTDNIPDEAIMKVTLKRIASNCKLMDAIVAVVQCLRDLNIHVVKMHCGEIQSSEQVIEATLGMKMKIQS